MAISTYAELKTAVQSWAQRGTSLSSVVADFVKLAETQIARDVRCRAMVQTATGTLSSATLAFPTRFLDALSVTINDVILQYLDPQQFDALSSDTHYFYTFRGQNFEFGQTGGAYSITYYQQFAAFSGDSDTNWLLTNHPDLYLFASLVEAAAWTREDPTLWVQRYQASKARLKQSENLSSAMPTVRIHPSYVV